MHLSFVIEVVTGHTKETSNRNRSISVFEHGSVHIKYIIPSYFIVRRGRRTDRFIAVG